MDLLSHIGMGLQVAALPENLLFCFIGVLMGTLIGVCLLYTSPSPRD